MFASRLRAPAAFAVALGSLITLAPTADAGVGPSPWRVEKTPIAHGRSVLVTHSTGAALTFRVRGPRVTMWFVAGPKGGRAAVFVNGKKSTVVDQYAPMSIRRSVVMVTGRAVNRLEVVALSTRDRRSRGTRVTVDAFAPTQACATKCVKTPRPIAAGGVAEQGTESIWYPDGVPTRGSANWTVAIGSYVRGGDVFPIDTAVPVIRAAACDQARKVPRGVVVLSFGMQTAAGTNGFGKAITPDQIVATTSAWAAGLAECGSGPWEVALGTSNSGGVTRYNGLVGGRAWGRLVDRARVESDPRTIVSGAVDLEPGWGPPGQARAWVDGYVRTTGARLWNFGSADACPQTVGKLTCGNGWTLDDVLWVSSHAGPSVVAMPQIHTKSGSQARQWAVLAARAIEIGVPLRIAAITVQTAACSQMRGGCPTTGVSAWDGWSQLRRALDAIPATVGTKVGAPMDIRWGWANGFVIPPPTTTTTSTTTSTSTTTTPTTTTTTPSAG